MRNNKGQIRIIEAFFASILILSSLALIPPGTNVQESNDQELYLKGRQVLITLDAQGYLSKLIENKSWSTIRECIESSLSSMIWFNLTVFDESMICLNDVQIGSGSPVNERMVSAQYICASSSRNYAVYIIHLQLSSVK